MTFIYDLDPYPLNGWSLLETTHLLQLVLGPGTVSLKTSHLLHRCQCFNVN